ncbi:unnamed protein product [Trypanosoma congolense IL3000]|uniref:WGS project CAEQ00000000 data, annotated contig 1262 n=1 Tax=Trypanosoma congolense (strain IL3000) TaxID=1068625 RepID=F9W511_TRYCI|nr:unnamed protein product [Trypanosoma congolense IL3000]
MCLERLPTARVSTFIRRCWHSGNPGVVRERLDVWSEPRRENSHARVCDGIPWQQISWTVDGGISTCAPPTDIRVSGLYGGVEKLRLMSILWTCSEGISGERLQLGRQLCNQLRIMQPVKGRHGVGIEALREAIVYPHTKRTTCIHSGGSEGRKASNRGPSESGAVCHMCLYGALQRLLPSCIREETRQSPKKRFQTPEAMTLCAFNILFHTPQVKQKGGSHMVEDSSCVSELLGTEGESISLTSSKVSSCSTAWGISRDLRRIERNQHPAEALGNGVTVTQAPTHDPYIAALAS